MFKLKLDPPPVGTMVTLVAVPVTLPLDPPQATVPEILKHAAITCCGVITAMPASSTAPEAELSSEALRPAFHFEIDIQTPGFIQAIAGDSPTSRQAHLHG
ncbi:hypothetical protein K32_13270 [Kaistia sp. 32K]|nr:hypothetical protein K32_13270 [Kaistia sp. 32K]